MIICLDYMPTVQPRHECGAFLTTIWQNSNQTIQSGTYECRNPKCRSNDEWTHADLG